jgi:hypothetical protein
MSTLRPPRLAVALLNWLLPENEPLIGDLIEEFEHRRSRLWFWRQTIAAIVLSRRSPRRHTAPLGLSNEPAPVQFEEVHLPVNLSASPLTSVGGLGIVSLGLVVALYRPGAWWFVLAAIAGGGVLGIVKVLRARRRFRQDPQTFLLQHGTRPPAGPRG